MESLSAMPRAPGTSNSKSVALKAAALQKTGPEPLIAIEAVKAKVTQGEAARKLIDNRIDMPMTTNMTLRSLWTTTRSNSRIIRTGKDENMFTCKYYNNELKQTNLYIFYIF